MVHFTLAGEKYPLCLTVAVLDDLQERGLRLKDIDTLYTPGEGRDMQDCIDNSLWLLERLMIRGHDYVLNNGPVGTTALTPLPWVVLRASLTPGQVLHEVIPTVCAAITEGLSRQIVAQHEQKKTGRRKHPPELRLDALLGAQARHEQVRDPAHPTGGNAGHDRCPRHRRGREAPAAAAQC